MDPSLPGDVWGVPESWDEPGELERARAEAAVRLLGLHSPYAEFEVTLLASPFLLVRSILPGERFPEPGATGFVVCPDDRVFFVPATPGTYVDAAEDVLLSRYAAGPVTDDDEHASLQTEIDVTARRRALPAW